MRVRHRRGYGVHSPFAFDFVTNVLYNGEMYYAYEEIDRNLHWWQKARMKSLRRLMFRLANYQRPSTIYCTGVDLATLSAMHRGSTRMTTLPPATGEKAQMIVVADGSQSALEHMAEGCMLVVWNLQRQRPLWHTVCRDERVTVTFDLYDVGVAFAKKELNKQHYIINW